MTAKGRISQGQTYPNVNTSGSCRTHRRTDSESEEPIAVKEAALDLTVATMHGMQTEAPFGIIATSQSTYELDLSYLQRKDSELSKIITYLETYVLPTDDKRTEELALTKQQYVIKACVL